MFFCREGAWIRTLLPKGASLRNFSCQCTLSQLRKKLQKGTSTGWLHDRSRPRSGVAHFAGAPPKLCIYDNSILLFRSSLPPSHYLPYLPSRLPSLTTFPSNLPSQPPLPTFQSNLPSHPSLPSFPSNLPFHLPATSPIYLPGYLSF